jgi:hypothetical protein
MWRQGYSAFFAYEGAAAAFGQEQSVVAAESGRSTFEFTGLRGFSRRSGGMMGWAAISSQTWFSFRRASSCLSHRHAT